MRNKNCLGISQEAIKIGQSITTGILLEASCSPSPGLVNPFSMGSHRDMNFFSFLLGSSTISPYFSLFAQLGMNWEERQSLLDELRKLGRDAEKQLLKATGGVNTQRGILFLGGVVAAASGMAINKEEITVDNISKNVSKICAGLVERELESLECKKNYTDGESLFLKYGIEGIRGEVEKGLPSIVNIGYPQFAKGMQLNIGLNNAMVDCLLHLIATVEDTTILSRLGINGLKKAQIEAKKVIAQGSIHTKRGIRGILDLDRYFIEENISPGGSADLLAISVAIYMMEEREIDLDSILRGYGDFYKNYNGIE